MDENDIVEVVLTKHGADVLNKYNQFLNSYDDSKIMFPTDYKNGDTYKGEFGIVFRIFYKNSQSTDKCFQEINVIK